jgi:geranylgeranyl diphosphate synthase type I
MSGYPGPLADFIPDIKKGVDAAARDCEWSEFEYQIARHLTNTRLPPHALLPVASAQAVGGDPRRALSVAVACCYLIVAMRWFDDAGDRDRDDSLCNDVGPGRAVNMAATALTVAWRVLSNDAELPPAALQLFGKSTIVLAQGQDSDLKGGVARTLDDYWTLMRRKTGTALALACEMGALAANPRERLAARTCGRFGEHMGVLLQILDDLDGTFHPDGLGDLRMGKATLPVLYGLAIDHPARAELADIVRTGRLAVCAQRVRDILDGIDTREFLVWCAFEERRQALSHLERHKQGSLEPSFADCDGLIAFADLLLVGWESLLPRSPVLSTEELVP